MTNLSVLDGDEIAAVLARRGCVTLLHRGASLITAERRAAGGMATGAKTTAVVLAATMALTLGCDGHAEPGRRCERSVS